MLLHTQFTTRPLHYADGKPRPRCRGLFHCLFTLCALVGCTWSIFTNQTNIGLCLLFKSITTGASALFHCYPYSSARTVTRGLVIDLMCVPFSAIGLQLLFVVPAPPPTPPLHYNNHFGFYFALQLVLLVGNLICVSYQFYHHVGLNTPQHKSDQPRVCCVALSLAVAHLFVWEHYQHHNNDRNRNSLTALLCGGIVTGFLGAVLAIPVTSAHKAPLSFPSTFPWHVVDWWGLHEDMHTMIGVSDLLFLLGAVLVSGASV